MTTGAADCDKHDDTDPPNGLFRSPLARLSATEAAVAWDRFLGDFDQLISQAAQPGGIGETRS